MKALEKLMVDNGKEETAPANIIAYMDAIHIYNVIDISRGQAIHIKTED